MSDDRHGRLTDAIVKRLEPPEKGNQFIWDTEQRGFGCRVTVGGTKAFIFDYRVRGTGRQRRPRSGGFLRGPQRRRARRPRSCVASSMLAAIREAMLKPTAKRRLSMI